MDKESKKALIAKYKQRKEVGGVYSITNVVTGEKHIASSTDIKGMQNRFEFMKEMGGCLNLSLKKEWDQYGKDAFRFEILEQLKKEETQTSGEFAEDVKTLESLWLEKYL